MKKLWFFLYGTENFKLEFDIPIDQAVENLKSKVSPSFFSRFGFERMVGYVSSDCVKVQRIVPMMKNSFKPVFVASFSVEGNKTILSGFFRFHRFVQIFMTFWFCFVSLWTLMASLTLVDDPSAWILLFVSALMFSFGIGLVTLGKWFARNDQNWLKDNVCHAINKYS